MSVVQDDGSVDVPLTGNDETFGLQSNLPISPR